MANKTFFDNKFDDYSPKAAASLLNETFDGLSTAFQEKLKIYINENLVIFNKEMMTEFGNDRTIYTGAAGLSFYFTKCAENQNEDKQDFLKRALSFVSIENLKNKRISFLCGDSGLLALTCVILHKLGNKAPVLLPSYQDLALRLMSLSSLLNDAPDELLYGRVGYLFSLLFVNKHIDGKETIPANHIKDVINMILKSGKQLAIKSKFDVPLMWKWHDKFYYGGAHGMAGILYILLQAQEYINVLEMHNYIKPSIDWLLSQQYPGGNFPSSRGSSADRLVQWCHGAPGFVPLCLLAHKIFEEQKYMEIALRCGEVVWERGLCSKGYSICHGVAGNAYTFIQLYQATKDPKHLYRACCFAEWVIEERPGTELHPPDRPASLFEGLTGRMYFVQDLLCIEQAKFPAFTV